MPRFSVYIHIPYCLAKCPYCDFNSHAGQRWPEGRYVGALVAEMRQYSRQRPWADAEVGTIFFGGGTPSLFSPDSIGAVLDGLRRCWPVCADAEITLEANPGSIVLAKLQGFRVAGINRMSFGVQSFSVPHLKRLGRIHGPEEAIAAVSLARSAGFDNVSLDLIFALPEQTSDEWDADLAQAVALRPDHVSAYNLTYEEGTPFHEWRARGTLRQLPEELEVAMFMGAQETLGNAGYEHYEISNYARPGLACRHNLNYWRSGPYLGIGAGAHSYSAADRGAPVSPFGCRWSNEKLPATYMQAVEANGQARVALEVLDARQAYGEFVFLALRCRGGVSAAGFSARFGETLPTCFPHVQSLEDDGLLESIAGYWRLTPRGLLLADSVFSTFL
jgi:putative oxygen-independent coproporphyrinogen III oxidase